jgi:hypothetical protein
LSRRIWRAVIPQISAASIHVSCPLSARIITSFLVIALASRATRCSMRPIGNGVAG